MNAQVAILIPALALSPAWVAVIVVAAVLVAALVWRASRRAALPGAEPRRALDSASAAPAPAPQERQVVAAPVEITDGMSLKDIKAARAARIERGYIESDASRAEKERRKGRGGADSAAADSRDVDAVSPGIASGAASADDTPLPAAVAPSPVAPPADDALGFDEAGWDEAAASISSTGERPRVQIDEVAAQEASDVVPTATAGSGAPSTPAGAALDTPPPAAAPELARPADAEPPPPAAPSAQATALHAGLEKTRGGFVARLGSLFAAKSTLDDDVMEQLEEVLFTADIGVKTGQRLIGAVQRRFASGDVRDPALVWSVLRDETREILTRHARRLEVRAGGGPTVLLMVGVNGAGKTTTIGKLAAQHKARGLKVLVVAGDTFRAAAVDQLAEWAGRVGVEIYSGKEGADPSGVVFDGLKHAAANGFDLVLCDTAGRLQTKAPLMDELRKIARVSAKAIEGAPHETVLVVDANTGQNAIQQARMFGEAVPLTGIVLTKLDGTAKGGVVIGISDELSVPIYAVGIGEAVADLRTFDPDEFVDALY